MTKLHWFKHILFMTEHNKDWAVQKKAMFSPLQSYIVFTGAIYGIHDCCAGK